MEVAYKDYRDNISTNYQDVFRCYRCADGCTTCTSSAPCLATYRWPFRVAVLAISIMCAFATIVLSCYLYRHRKVKVFKVASPIFLTITLLGCAIMYLEVCMYLYWAWFDSIWLMWGLWPMFNGIPSTRKGYYNSSWGGGGICNLLKVLRAIFNFMAMRKVFCIKVEHRKAKKSCSKCS